MNPLHTLSTVPPIQRQVLFVAAVAAAALLSMYVQLLHTSLARGDELRELQRIAGIRKAVKPAAPAPRKVALRAKAGPDATVASGR
jgi:hypothetical protein